MKLLKRLEDIYAAAAFAEAGEAKTARQIMGKQRKAEQQKKLPARKTIARRLKHGI